MPSGGRVPKPGRHSFLRALETAVASDGGVGAAAGLAGVVSQAAPKEKRAERASSASRQADGARGRAQTVKADVRDLAAQERKHVARAEAERLPSVVGAKDVVAADAAREIQPSQTSGRTTSASRKGGQTQPRGQAAVSGQDAAEGKAASAGRRQATGPADAGQTTQGSARGGSSPEVLSRLQATLRERRGDTPPVVEPQKRGRTPVPKPVESAGPARGVVTAKSASQVAGLGPPRRPQGGPAEAADSRTAAQPAVPREPPISRDALRTGQGARWQYRAEQPAESAAGRGPAAGTGVRDSARANSTGEKLPSGGGGTETPRATADPTAAADASGGRQYLAQTGGAAPGVIQSTVRQAAADAHGEIVRQAHYTRRNGQSEVTVQLHPPEMGRMRIAVEMRDGKLDVQIKIENPQVREAMRAELEGLGRALKDGQLDLGRLEVSDYAAGQENGRQGAPAEGGSALASLPSSPPGMDEASRARGWAVFTGAGGADCLI